MASLRKRKPPGDVVVTAGDPVQPVTVAIDTNPPPASSPSPEPTPAIPTIDASEALRAQLEALRQAETLQQVHQQQQQAIEAAEGHRRDWLRKSALAKKHYNSLNALHGEALSTGISDVSEQYFDFMNNRLAEIGKQHPPAAAHLIGEMQQRSAQNRTQEQQPPKPSSAGSNGRHVSAPVSREPVLYSAQRPAGRVTLTTAERESAWIAGISEAEYAKQKINLIRAKDEGRYTREQ